MVVMASAPMIHNFCSASSHSAKFYYNNNKNQSLLSLTYSNFLTGKPFLKVNRKTLFSNISVRFNKPLFPPTSLVFRALQSNFFKVVQTVWKVGQDGIEAGTNLVPDSVPRPIARVSVTIVAVAVTLFVLKSFLSTAFFGLATMGLVYFIFIALNKDQGPRGGGGGGTDPMEDPVEEARKIMEKYK